MTAVEKSITSAREGITHTSAVYALIRADIMNGTLEAGSKLKTRSLAERFNVGLSPIREALSRLSSEGWVQQNDRRGFSVVPVSVAELHDLHIARCMMNETALRASIKLGDEQWEENVQLSRFRITRMERPADMTRGAAAEKWNRLHREYHSSLINACGSQRLVQYCEQLFDALERYRRLGAPHRVARDSVSDEHAQIADAAINRDVEAAVELLNTHFERTIAHVEPVIRDMTKT